MILDFVFFPRQINTSGQQPPVRTALVSLVYVNTNVNTHAHVNTLLNSSIKRLQCAGVEAAAISYEGSTYKRLKKHLTYEEH